MIGVSQKRPTNRKYILTLGLLAASLVTATEVQGQIKIGTVDMNRTFKEYGKTKEAEAKINEAKNAAKKEYDERAESYKKALEEINQINAQIDAPALGADVKTSKAKERDEKIAAIRKMEREINEFRQTREQQLQQQVVRMREGIVKEITDIVLEQVKSKTLDLVFDKSGPSLHGFSPLLFSPESADFTADVIVELNKKERATSPTTSEQQPAAPAKPAATKP